MRMDSSGAARACSSHGWSAAALALGPGDNRVARFPHLALGRHHDYVVGVDIQTFGLQRIENSPLVVSELGGSDLGRPTGRFAFLYPRAAVDANDRLRLFWGEPAVVDSEIQARQWVAYRPTTIWTAVYDPAAGWSNAHELDVGTNEPRWRWPGVADNLGSAVSEQGFAVPGMRVRPSFPYFAIGGGDDLERVLIPVNVAYASLITVGPRLLVAYAAADTSWASSPQNPTREDMNSVFVRRSEDEGRTWSAPTLIQRGGQTPAHQITALVAPSKTIHLLWIQATGSGSVIRHVLSDDGGVHWSEPDDLPATNLNNIRAAIDPCGDVRLIAEDWSGGVNRLQLVAATWNGVWSAPTRLFKELKAMTPDLRVSNREI